MKINFSLLLFALVFVSCTPKELPTIFNNTDDYIEVKLSHQTTKQEIEKITQELAVKGITVDTKGTTYFEDGRLKSLVLTAVWKDGTGGKITSDLMNLQFKYCGFVYKREGEPHLKFGQF